MRGFKGQLFDSLIEAAKNPEYKVLGYSKKKPRARMYLKNLMDRMKAADRFSVDGDTVAMVTQASVTPPDTLVKMFHRAHAPHEKTWIEWDETLRVKVGSLLFGTAQEEPRSPRSGFLIEKMHIEASDSLYRVTVASVIDDKPIIMPAGFFYDVDNPLALWQLQTHDEKILNKLGEIFTFPGIPRDALFGIEYVRKYEGGPEAIPLRHLGKFVRYGFSDSVYYLRLPDIQKLPPDEQRKFARQQVVSVTGDFRFMVALLGVINTLEIRTTSLSPSEKDRLPVPVSGPRGEYFVYRVVEITVPSERVVDAITREHPDREEPGLPKRRHKVRGSWRTSKKTGIRRWHPPYKRGDASRGWVIKDYVLKTSPRFRELAKRVRMKAEDPRFIQAAEYIMEHRDMGDDRGEELLLEALEKFGIRIEEL